MSKCAKVANPCKVCLGNVTIKTGIQCKGACKSWVHYKCLNYTPGKICDVKDGYIKVNCPCPDCLTMTDKDYVAYENLSCSNISCPANKQPKCENTGCPVNKKLSSGGLPQEKCGKSCKKTQDKSVSSPAKPIPTPISASSSYGVSDSSQNKVKKEKPKKENPKKEKAKKDRSEASSPSSRTTSECSCVTSSDSRQEKGKNESFKKDKPTEEKPKKDFSFLGLQKPKKDFSFLGFPQNNKTGASSKSSSPTSGCSCVTSCDSTQEKGKKEKPKKEKSKKDKTKASSKTSSPNSGLSNISEGTCGCRSSNGDGGKSGDSATAAIDEMCNTVGKLAKQINDLMIKMKKSVKEQSKGGCVPSRGNNCTQSGPPSQCPQPCHCDPKGKESIGKKLKFF